MKIYNQIIITLIITMLSQQLCSYNAERYYNRKRIHNFDIFHKYLPEIHNEKMAICNNIFIFTISLYILYSKHSIIKPFIITLCNLFILRSIAINITIPPKYKKCKIYKYEFGYCYEKYISGHFSFLFLSSLFGLENGLLNMSSMILLNSINGLLILLQRNHYSVDILFAIIASIFVKQNPFF